MQGFLSTFLGQENPLNPPTDATTDSGALLLGVAKQVEYYTNIVCVVILSICGALAILFAVYVGFKMASAEDEGKRTEAKAMVIYSIIGAIAIAVLGVMLQVVIPKLKVGIPAEVTQANIDGVDPIVNATQIAVVNLVNSIVTIISNVSVVFAVWVGWKLMKAEDPKSRQNAKMQLLFTIIGVVVVVLLNTIAQTIIGAYIPDPYKLPKYT